MLYTSEGNLRAEDRAFRFIARERLNAALAQMETQTKAIVDDLIARIGADARCKVSADELLDIVENHPSLQSKRTMINRYSDAFPELKETAFNACERINQKTFNRLQTVLAPREIARRFATTKGAHLY